MQYSDIECLHDIAEECDAPSLRWKYIKVYEYGRCMLSSCNLNSLYSRGVMHNKKPLQCSKKNTNKLLSRYNSLTLKDISNYYG